MKPDQLNALKEYFDRRNIETYQEASDAGDTPKRQYHHGESAAYLDAFIRVYRVLKGMDVLTPEEQEREIHTLGH